MLFKTPRLKRYNKKKDAREFTSRAVRSIVLESAARAWAHGVPWAEALQISETVVGSQETPSPKALPRKRRGQA